MALKAKKRVYPPLPLYPCDAPKCEGTAIVQLDMRSGARQRLCMRHAGLADEYYRETDGAERPRVTRV